MSAITNRIAIAGLIVCLLGEGRQLAAQGVETLRQMPKARTDPQQAQTEQLPLPRELRSETSLWEEPESAACCELPLRCTRINRYDIWQYYAVGHQGKFRPRVIYSGYGSYYADDGRPYPWISDHPLDFMPYAVSP